MKRPERIRVLGKPVTTKYVPSGDELLKDGPDDKHPGAARSDPDRQLIAVEDGQPLENEQDCIVHEIFHILEDWMCIKISENAVKSLATGFLAVMKDNPSLVSYLRRKK